MGVSIVIALGAYQATRGSQSSKPAVAEATGVGPGMAPLFHVDRTWEVHWESTGAIQSIMIRDANQNLKALIKRDSGSLPKQDHFPIADPGDYYATIDAVGRWKLRIVQDGP